MNTDNLLLSSQFPLKIVSNVTESEKKPYTDFRELMCRRYLVLSCLIMLYKNTAVILPATRKLLLEANKMSWMLPFP
jgi:hypothetical protein